MEASSFKIDLDKLPIKRLDAIDELGNEHFPPDLSHEEKRLNMIRQIDFSGVVERDAKKLKSSKEAAPPAPARPWQGLVENLHLAHQELSVILDLINTVEENDAVTVAGMQKPKQLNNEVLSDFSVSVATKLQRLRQLGKYFKQSSKALEQQVGREARFYGSLFRLQQNWKVKRQRLAATGPGSEGFVIDLSDNSSQELTTIRPSSLSTVCVEHDSAGVLAVQLPLKSCRSLCLRYHGVQATCKPRSVSKRKMHCSVHNHSREAKKENMANDDANECIKDTHFTLREIHQSIFEEQVFDMVNRETYNQSPGVNVTGMREDLLQLGIDQEASLCLCLISNYEEDDSLKGHGEMGPSHSNSLELVKVDERCERKDLFGFPTPASLQIYLLHIFHQNALGRAKERYPSANRPLMPGQHAGDDFSLLGHFCMTISHRIFSSKVLLILERLVSRVPYLRLSSHPCWHSRTSSWSLLLRVPQSILHAGRQTKHSSSDDMKSRKKLQFHTKVVVNDDKISVSGEGAPSIIGSVRSHSVDVSSVNCYGCDLEHLPVILLQQAASQIVRWLHEEALVVGMKVSRDFLCLYFELEQGDDAALGLVAHVDPDDDQGCISWWVVIEDGSAGAAAVEGKLLDECENRRFLGYLSLESLYSTMMDLVNLCSSVASH